MTLIAGANSSGKSSFMQPFLLMKQSIEAQFDPGPLLIHGENIQLAEWAQVFTRGRSANETASSMLIGIKEAGSGFENRYRWNSNEGLWLESTAYLRRNSAKAFYHDMSKKDVMALLSSEDIDFVDTIRKQFTLEGDSKSEDGDGPEAGRHVEMLAVRNRCFIEPSVSVVNADGASYRMSGVLETSARSFVHTLRGIIHVPGLRGNPARSYATAVPGATYPGTIDRYIASILLGWDQSKRVRDKEHLRSLSRDLELLGLTWKVVAKKIDDARVRLLVGRLPHAQQSGANDLVNIADVGFGVSQTLPVLVALHVAAPRQIVYIEQPELHLHPRAQTVMGRLLAEAALRGVRVVVETHSSLILRAVQTAIASGVIDKNDVRLHWFSRSELDGTTRVTTAELNGLGQFGEWPVDFDDVAEASDWAYLRAVEEASIGESK